MSIEIIRYHLPWITQTQADQLDELVKVFLETNSSINLVSRKDTDHFWTRHILHSVSIAMAIRFAPGLRIADVGTGGGLPGLPLAVLFPESHFTLIDSIGKKIRAVQSMVDKLGLKNVTTINARMEDVEQEFDFVVSRAVKPLPMMEEWLRGKIRKGNACDVPNGLIYIKGGEFQEELDEIGCTYRYWYLDDWFDDPFFETKKIVWLNIAS